MTGHFAYRPFQFTLVIKHDMSFPSSFFPLTRYHQTFNFFKDFFFICLFIPDIPGSWVDPRKEKTHRNKQKKEY